MQKSFYYTWERLEGSAPELANRTPQLLCKEGNWDPKSRDGPSSRS